MSSSAWLPSSSNLLHREASEALPRRPPPSGHSASKRDLSWASYESLMVWKIERSTGYVTIFASISLLSKIVFFVGNQDAANSKIERSALSIGGFSLTALSLSLSPSFSFFTLLPRPSSSLIEDRDKDIFPYADGDVAFREKENFPMHAHRHFPYRRRRK